MMEKLSAEEVLSRYARGERDFSWRDLSGLDLHGADLRDANFTGAVLFATNLNGANLERANLNQASLQNAWLRDSNLRWASLLDADLTGADLTGADLTGAIVQLSRTSNQVTSVRVQSAKSAGLAGFLEYIFPGTGFLYCDQTRKGTWILIGTIVANFVIFAPIIAPAFLPRDVFEAVYTPIGPLLGILVTALFFVGFFGNIIWLIVRIIWAANTAAAHNKRRTP